MKKQILFLSLLLSFMFPTVYGQNPDVTAQIVNTEPQYLYDANGNMIKDSNKNITNIKYNFLNLPEKVEFADGRSIEYNYRADGIKARTLYKNGNNIEKRIDYCGSYIYEDGELSKIMLPEGIGYITMAGNTPTYHYYQQDHQGNNRVVVDQNGNVEEVNHYYPFGEVFETAGNVQPYKYNGKEMDRTYGLNLYDYSARQMDPKLGRFTTMDPMAEKYYSISPYAYCNNNPVKYVDPTGRDFRIWYKNDQGKDAHFVFNGRNAAQAPKNGFVNATIAAYEYDVANGGGKSLQAIATNSNIKVGITEYDKDQKFSPSGNFIRFNPNAGLSLDDGNILSPATLLEHEAKHALDHNSEGGLDKTADKQYGVKYERAAIQGAELETAKANKELPQNHRGRQSHKAGKWVFTDSPTSNRESNPAKSQELRDRIENFRNSWTSGN